MRKSRVVWQRVVTGFAVLGLLAGAGGFAQTSLVVNRLQVVSAAGTPAENCVALRAALATIDDASAANPYTLRLEPGEYACGDETLTTKPFVDIEGSGEGVTRITGTRDSDLFGVIDLKGSTELRFVTVEALEDPTRARVAVSASAGSSRIVHARLIAGEGDFFTSCGLFVGSIATVHVRDSTVSGELEGINVASGGAAVVAYSQLRNGFFREGSLICLYSYDESLGELASNCAPPLT